MWDVFRAVLGVPQSPPTTVPYDREKAIGAVLITQSPLSLAAQAPEVFVPGEGWIPASRAARDTVVEAVHADLLRRSQVGITKYGVTLARTDLTLKDWLQHAYEETLDQANYLKRAIMELEKTDGN